jgi:hypothetical protein
MSNDSYKAWIDAMPIDDVRRRIERIERKLSDLQTLERLYADRHGGGDEEPPAAAEEGAPESQGWSEGEYSPPENG